MRFTENKVVFKKTNVTTLFGQFGTIRNNYKLKTCLDRVWFFYKVLNFQNPITELRKSFHSPLEQETANFSYRNHPQEAISIMKPFTHLRTNLARFVHQTTVISWNQEKFLVFQPLGKIWYHFYSQWGKLTSVISPINNTGMVNVVISFEQAVFKIFLRPKMVECLELISSKRK